MKLGIKDIVFMNLIGIFSLRQIPYVAQYGAASVLLWLVAALGFFIPLALICGELGAKFQKSGGMFLWINKAFGVKIAYYCLICYLLSCLTFFPMMLYFAANSLAFLLEIKAKSYFIAGFSIICFVFLTFINYLGLNYTKLINKISVYFGIVLPMVLLIVISFLFYENKGYISTPYSSGFFVDFDLNTLVFASSMMFAFAGLELSTMIGAKIENYSRAIFLSAFLIVAIYIIGTFCLNVLYPAKLSDILDGIMQAMQNAENELKITKLSTLMSLCLFFGTLGQVNSWLVAPIYMLASASKEGVIKFYEAKPHPIYKTPYRALFFQAFIVSMVCLFCAFFTDTKDIYWTLSSLTTVSYFLPYIAMFLAYFKLKNTANESDDFSIKNRFLSYILASIGLLSVFSSLILCFIAPDEDKYYFFEILLAPLLALIIVLLSFDKTCKKS